MHFRKIAAALCAVLSVTLASAAAASPKVAVSDHKFTVNGKAVTPQAYNVDGYNYFKLRDVAYLLSDTTAPFNVTWTPSQSSVIHLISGQKYQKVGGELSEVWETVFVYREIGIVLHIINVHADHIQRQAVCLVLAGTSRTSSSVL